MISSTIRAFTCLIILSAVLSAVLLLFGCRDTEPDKQTALTAEMPLHLEDHLDTANIEGSEVPADVLKPVEWSFDEPQPDWKPVKPIPAEVEAVQPVRTDDALRVTLTTKNRRIGKPLRLFGAICVELPDWNIEDWAYVEIRARTGDRLGYIALGFNYTEEDRAGGAEALLPFYNRGGYAPLVTDGTIQTYRLSLDSPSMRKWEGPWTHLGIAFSSQENEEAATLDILSVSVIPKAAVYADAAVGVRTEVRDQAYRRSLYAHTPASLEYRVRLPEGARLDVGLGVLREDVPVTFRIIARTGSGTAETLFEETYADPGNWAQRSVDLSHLAGHTVTLALGADAERAGTVALWAAPTLAGTRNTDKPNVILYIIDGAGAKYMSVYGYNRRTTPNLERLAAEGAAFEHAYSNSRWTKPSTASFMTSLQHSVLGGYTSMSDPLPAQATTMAEHLHQAGYQTAVISGNPNAGRMSSLDRGVDAFRDAGMWDFGAGPSSIALHQEFWRWREAFPGQPFWVHFQTTDVHLPGYFVQSPPFAGLYLEPARRAEYLLWNREVGYWPAPERFDETGIDRLDYYDRTQRLYSEAMAEQDHEIGKLVDRLKSMGEWSNTLFIVASDHGEHESGLIQLEPYPLLGQHTHLRPEHTRIPMIFVWPGHIAGGQRFSQPVSMIDMLPTVLELVELPLPKVMMGQSLAPLLLGNGGWEPHPVILDEFYVDSESGEQRGWIEVIDGRWGASLAINPHIEFRWRTRGEYIAAQRGERPAPLLLYDLWNDPFCMTPLNDERPDLVEKYTRFLEAQWEAHQTLAQQFTPSEASPLTPEQLQTLRSLGYIQ